MCKKAAILNGICHNHNCSHHPAAVVVQFCSSTTPCCKLSIRIGCCVSSGGAPTPAGTSVFTMLKICTHMKCEVKIIGYGNGGFMP